MRYHDLDVINEIDWGITVDNASSKQGGSRARLRDIAAHAGVHISTASRVLNGDPRGEVSADTTARVLAAADTLQYKPNSAARNLRLRRAGAFGLLIPDLTHPTYATLVRGALQEAEGRGLAVLITEVPDGAAAIGLRRLVDDHRIDGLLIATASDRSAQADWFEGHGVPTVYVNRRAEGKPTVTVDDEAGAALALRTMYDYGHRRVGVISGPHDVDTARRRLDGFISAANTLGIPVPVESCGEYTANGGASALTSLMSDPNPPTAIFASNLMSGIGALSRASAHGIRIPDELSLVVFDDAEIADFTVPALTRIKMPFDELGALAVRSLIEVLDGRQARDLRVETPPQLIGGASLGPNMNVGMARQ
ncbi:LacI family DNA-binding transcriptional regulator [Gordonia sp. LSe1-13]|uniref:LacI family DNA-binding transcriptional regulator n=1 Tax=Gordonia sesuvii TaxID=3116777 RepID=A0ABU7MAH4_9ACTN|nr:LacI family DNA-binding transcriptional regulator [Gordonia sp. LSe1-13]